MVKTVIGNQLSKLRKEKKICAEIPFDYRLLITALSLLFPLNQLNAKEFGIHGVIYPIEEQDPIALIQQKLKGMEERGELEEHNKKLQKKTKEAIERPRPVKGITKAEKTRVFYFDPTYVVKEDLKDHKEQIIYQKGTKINPLETVTLSQDLLFFDGDDPEQKAWAQARIQKSADSDQNDKKVRLILVKGAPLALSEEIGILVYFDQGGILTKKLGIHHVPALVTQEDLHLRIEEACLQDKESGIQGGENK
ncbi:MAG: type-F conjugative transfer system protein TraW [Proteobacteria bacterium]|nr:type-F conjugative transfer system protein TraW [Pseudomonadota bacterium]